MNTLRGLKGHNEKLVQLAREGDVLAQKELFTICDNSSLAIALQYVRKSVYVGVNYSDLRYLVNVSFLKAIQTYEEGNTDFIDYFKYIYMMDVKGEIRKQTIISAREVHLGEESQAILELHSQDFIAEKTSTIFDEALIVQAIINNEVVTLTKKEYTVLTMYLRDIPVKQISEQLQRNYTETLRVLKRAILKVKKYFEKPVSQ